MPSPFPGMDPYLEGHLWPDVHHRLATQISRQLAPQVQPNYVARLEISVIEDKTFETEIGVMYPDVQIVRTNSQPYRNTAVAEPVASVAPLTITIPQVRLSTVEIRDTLTNKLVTSIEILSPVNKREPNLSKYLEKRQRICKANVHLLEVDLLRRGNRVWNYKRIPRASYFVALTRAASSKLEVWPIALTDFLPVLPVPLRHPDADVTLDLGAALKAVYDEAFYQLSIDYEKDPPPPALSEKEKGWMGELLS